MSPCVCVACSAECDRVVFCSGTVKGYRRENKDCWYCIRLWDRRNKTSTLQRALKKGNKQVVDTYIPNFGIASSVNSAACRQQTACQVKKTTIKTHRTLPTSTHTLCSFDIHMSVHRNIFPNYNQQDATFLDLFISTDALHVSGGSSAHHQEHITVHTASGIAHRYCC